MKYHLQLFHFINVVIYLEFAKMYLYVLEQILKEQCYDELRTKQTLVYVSILLKKSVRGNFGLCCLNQSNVKEPEYISGRIEISLKKY